MGSAGNWTLETTNTVGTGSITLAGSSPGYSKFSDSIPAGLVWYSIDDNGNKEAGEGTFDGNNQLVRTTVHATLVNGVYDNTNPQPIALSGSNAIVACTFNTQAYNEIAAHLSDTSIHYLKSDIDLPDLGDVFDGMTPIEGQVLTYNAANGWQSEDASGGVTDHGDLTGLLDDDHTQYHNDIRGDVRYYPQSNFINSSGGVGSAGRPIVLDADGNIDATMINDADIDHTNIGSIGTNTHAQIDTHIADSTIHFTEASIDHTAIQNVGTNTHTQIDTHIADGTIHYAQTAIDHTVIQNVGTNTHAQIDSHIADVSIHREDTFLLDRANHTGTQLHTTISDFDAGVQTNRLDQLAAPTASVDMNSQLIINLATPLSASDAATKGYIDTLVQGLSWQEPVEDQDLTDPPGTPTTGDRYIIASPATGAWTGQEEKITEWNGASWVFITPDEGFATWVKDEDLIYVYNGTHPAGEWIAIGSAGVTDHGNLTGLLDDDHTQYHNDTRGDARYYQQSEFLQASTGAADAGKPVALDADGNIDSTMINDADISHLNITDIGTNTHAQIDTHIANTVVHFDDAPNDGKIYARQNNTWVEIHANSFLEID